jgi:hypothetical protein
MSIQETLDVGYALYTFPLTHQELVEWQILSPDIPLNQRLDCLISSLALLKLVNRQRAEIIATDIHLGIADDRFENAAFAVDKLHDLEFDKSGINYEIIMVPFSIASISLQNFHDFKTILANNSATIVTLIPNNDGAGHAVIMAKDDNGELFEFR